jgi:uncharacterized membrane protein YedE/YeeE
MHDFAPVPALVGGALIGLAASAMLFFLGRVAGVSGIAGGLLDKRPTAGDALWRAAFVAGLVIGGALLAFAYPAAFPSPPADPSAALIVAGLLVGFGTRLGNGCTSGHGVCGVSRLSRRSLVATATFMATAIVTVFVTRHVIGGGR